MQNDNIQNGARPHPEMEQDFMRIKGWGIDVDPENHPSYPMRDSAGEDTKMPRPTQQKVTVEILKSNERPKLSAVFGTSTPPSGLSGIIRRRAFRYSESRWSHWLLLLFADRINVVEGVFQDFGRGRIPNIFAEMGMGSELKYNRRNCARKALVAGGVGLCAYLLYRAIR